MGLLFRASPFFKVRELLAATASTVQVASSNETCGEILYGVTQIIDVLHFDADCALCGEDEAPIYEYSLPILADRFSHRCSGAYLRMAPGLCETEMHASTAPDNKLMLSDDIKTMKRKLTAHLATLTGDPDSSPLVHYLRGPISALLPKTVEFEILHRLPRRPALSVDAIAAAVERVFQELRCK